MPDTETNNMGKKTSSNRSAGGSRNTVQSLRQELEALRKSQSMIEFDMDGKILTANDKFLNVLGYSLEEVQGRHHSIFVDEKTRDSDEYREFWERLKRGEYITGEYRRFGKNSREVWIQGSYNPILDASGKPYKVVKYAIDVTQRKLRNADFASQIDAIRKSQAVIEFDMDGTILGANDVFLDAMGYRLEEVEGQHHKIFVEPEFRDSDEYAEFWERLKQGEFIEAEYKRIGKGGREVWIQGSYNPILGLDGRPCKVIKFAKVVTDEVNNRKKIRGLSRVFEDAADPIILEDIKGNVLDMNKAVESEYGWSRDELIGQPIKRIVPEDRHGQADQLLNRCKSGEEIRDVEGLRVTRAGREISVLLTLSLLTDDEGQAIAIASFAKEITALKEAEAHAQARMRDLADIIAQVIEASAQQSDGARTIAESSALLSDGAQTQAASVEEITASISELIRSIQVISQNSGDCKQQAEHTVQIAGDGSQSVEEAINAIRLIEKSSEQIDEIIQVISEIASQTNLLALNAAIEAARAGEHGLGFAVVADEVRKLAERSSEAAKEITQLIKESSRRVAEGAQMSEKVGDALSGIVAAVQQTAQGIAQIAEQTEAQSTSADDVKSAIRVVSDTTEANAASAEELAASAEQLGAQAHNLQELVGKFNV